MIPPEYLFYKYSISFFNNISCWFSLCLFFSYPLLPCKVIFCLNHNAKTWLLIKYLLLTTINLYTCFKYKSWTQNDLCPWSNAGLYIALRISTINCWLALRWCYAYVCALAQFSVHRASMSQICFFGVVLTSQCYIYHFVKPCISWGISCRFI